MTPENDRVYNLARLGMIDWPNAGGAKVLTAGFDRSVGSYASTPDSKTIYLLAEEAGHEKLFNLPANGGDVKLAFEMTQGVYTNLKIPTRPLNSVLLLIGKLPSIRMRLASTTSGASQRLTDLM